MEPSLFSPDGRANARATIAAFGGAVRAGEWWQYKLVPIFTAFIATLVMLRQPVWAAWQGAAALLLSIAAGAAFVSLLNDWTDVDEDRRAGKANRMADRRVGFRAAALALPILVGSAFLIAWRDAPLLAGAYLAAWIAFALYSLPPFRLKGRGFPGVLADASGAHLFPTLVAILLAFRSSAAPADPLWAAAGAAWALGYGLRGILWHQLSDRENDRVAGVRTFAARHSREVAKRVGVFIAFPLELAGLAAMVWIIGSILPVLLLGVYLAMVWVRLYRWSMVAVVVEPQPRYFIWLHEYYDVFFPIALLAASSLRHPPDLLVLGAYLLLFHQRPLQTAREMWGMFYRVLHTRRSRS